MNVRDYTVDDYPTLRSWWLQYQWKQPPEQIYLPRGFVCEQDECPLAAGFVYMVPDACLAWMDYIVGNPNVSAKDRVRAV